MMTQRQAVQAAPGALEVYAPRLDDLFTRANQVQVPARREKRVDRSC